MIASILTYFPNNNFQNYSLFLSMMLSIHKGTNSMMVDKRMNYPHLITIAIVAIGLTLKSGVTVRNLIPNMLVGIRSKQYVGWYHCVCGELATSCVTVDFHAQIQKWVTKRRATSYQTMPMYEFVVKILEIWTDLRSTTIQVIKNVWNINECYQLHDQLLQSSITNKSSALVITTQVYIYIAMCFDHHWCSAIVPTATIYDSNLTTVNQINIFFI